MPQHGTKPVLNSKIYQIKHNPKVFDSIKNNNR